MCLGCWKQLLMPCFKVEEVLAVGLVLQSQVASLALTTSAAKAAALWW